VIDCGHWWPPLPLVAHVRALVQDQTKSPPFSKPAT